MRERQRERERGWEIEVRHRRHNGHSKREGSEKPEERKRSRKLSQIIQTGTQAPFRGA